MRDEDAIRRALIFMLEADPSVAMSKHEAQSRGLDFYYTGYLCRDAPDDTPHIAARSCNPDRRKCVVCFNNWRAASRLHDDDPMTQTQARTLGLAYYTPLHRCRAGHRAKRNTKTNVCSACKRADRLPDRRVNPLQHTKFID